ncbi:MAG TPA: hypothetical protein VJR48_16145, partial [Ktedonobacterales bacterium]|nr:hypothetical protein [Ktedonobacterales bacterium]
NEYIWWLAERAGTLACTRGEPEQAARLYAAGTSHRDAIAGPVEPVECELRARDLAWLRETMDNATLACALSEGQALPLDEAVSSLRETLEC